MVRLAYMHVVYARTLYTHVMAWTPSIAIPRFSTAVHFTSMLSITQGRNNTVCTSHYLGTTVSLLHFGSPAQPLASSIKQLILVPVYITNTWRSHYLRRLLSQLGDMTPTVWVLLSIKLRSEWASLDIPWLGVVRKARNWWWCGKNFNKVILWSRFHLARFYAWSSARHAYPNSTTPFKLAYFSLQDVAGYSWDQFVSGSFIHKILWQ